MEPMAQAQPDDMAWQAIMQRLGLSPEDFDALVNGTAAFPEEAGMVNDEMGMAQQMANTPMPEMRQVGRVAVASNPLEMLAAGIGRVKGMKGVQAGQGRMASMIDALRRGRGAGMRMAATDRLGEEPGTADPVAAPEDLSIPELLRRPRY